MNSLSKECYLLLISVKSKYFLNIYDKVHIGKSFTGLDFINSYQSTLPGGEKVGKGTLYDTIPVELLAGFYYHINMNIKRDILSEKMYHEMELIEQVAKRKCLSLDQLYRQGSKMV